MESEVCSELLRLLKIQRHDFLNHLQVVHSLLQMGKTDRALQYLDGIAKEHNSVQELLKDHAKRTDCSK